MSATVSAARLKEAASWAGRAISARPAVPVMGAAVVTVADGTLTVSGWDWDTLTRHTSTATGDLERSLVNGRLLVDIASRLDGEVELHREGTRLHLRAGRSRVALDTMPVEEYPNEPAAMPEVGVLDGFGEFIGRVAPSVGDRDAQPTWLQGVLLEATAGEFTAMATDRYIISHSVVTWTGDDFAINIPGRPLLEVARQLDDKVTVGIGNGIAVADDDRFATVLATDESNANVKQYLDIAAWTHGSVDLDRDALTKAIGVVAPTVGKGMPVRLYVADDGVTLKSADRGVGESESGLDASLNGDERAIAISPAYLTKALDATPSEVVRINFGASPRKPVLIHGLAGDEPDLTTRHIVMPVRVDDIH
jgi:DNA polymerase-3 subunit beta